MWKSRQQKWVRFESFLAAFKEKLYLNLCAMHYMIIAYHPVSMWYVTKNFTFLYPYCIHLKVEIYAYFSLFFLGDEFQEIKLDAEYTTENNSEPNDDVLLDLGASSSSGNLFCCFCMARSFHECHLKFSSRRPKPNNWGSFERTFWACKWKQ